MPLRIGFVGFRHTHIYSLYEKAAETDGVQVVAACEEDDATRAEAVARGVRMTHRMVDDLIGDDTCDVIAIGDYYSRRGALALQALTAGKHVIVDKPLCTNLAELDEIERLAGERELKVGCMLTMRDSRPMNGLRDLVRVGTIGEVKAISFGGQHPLNLGSRPAWYFEPGKHGGTINDIGIHAIDAIPWMTGLQFKLVNSARCWNANAPQYPDFRDGAQMMLTMDNGCGVLGDVSYFMPSNGGYSLPFYWRTTIFGEKGILEVAVASSEIIVALEGGLEARALPEVKSGGYFAGFLKDIRGEAGEEDLDTGAVIRAARTVLKIQKAADEGTHDVPLTGA
jgi:predicted dehydrogenase